MTLVDIKDWLKTLNVAEHYYIGRLDNKQEQSLGIYDGSADRNRPVMALGGLQNSSYNVRAITLLLHWNRDKQETEEAARSLWDQLVGVHNLDITERQSSEAQSQESETVSKHIHYLQMTVPEPIGVGTDDSGIYEYVINFNLYYRR